MRHASAQVVELVGVIWETVDHKYAPLDSKGDSCELQDAKRISEGVEDAKSDGVAVECKVAEALSRIRVDALTTTNVAHRFPLFSAVTLPTARIQLSLTL